MNMAPEQSTSQPQGPSWPYPSIEKRKAPNGPSTLTAQYFAGGFFLLLMGLVAAFPSSTLIVKSVEFGSDSMDYMHIMAVVIGLCLVLAGLWALGYGIYGLIAFPKIKKACHQAFDELVRTGIRCWGRVLSAETTYATSDDKGLGWFDMRICVEPFAASLENSQASHPMPAGTPMNSIAFGWRISEFQTSYVQPGSWCALLVHPRKHPEVFLDGFATQDGQFVPKE